MTRARAVARALAILLPLLAALPTMSRAADGPAAPRQMRLGYVELTVDPRYDPQRAHDEVAVRPLGRPFVGAREGVEESAQIGRVIGVEFSLTRAREDTVDALAAAVSRWLDDGIHFVIADLPAAALLDLADRFRGRAVLFFNAAAPEDRLRGAACRANVAHTIPSEAMRSDALMQYLVFKKWRKILVLQGPLEADRDAAAAVARSAKRFGASIVAVKPFRLTRDPRQREQSNVSLMTAGEDYDVAWVIDSDGDFARYVPYQINLPRPTVGSAGLVATGWTWSWDSHGALQLENRFDKLAGRRMAAVDWAAWAAVKVVVQAVLRSRATDFEPVRDFLLSDRLTADGYKGNPMSFRHWDHQLRQPMLIATGNAVIARAPLAGFLHRSNNLDTLGIDEPESTCRF